MGRRAFFPPANKIHRRNTYEKIPSSNYSIGNVAKITGATKKQIRNWEASGHIPKADRVQYGDRAYRRFSLKQVELISKIRELRDEGYTVAAAAETLQPGKKPKP
jgi:DNA-binding transcriptional MerR regulator